MASYTSVTQLKEFMDCPYRFYLKRIKRVKEKYISSAIILGSSVHQAAESIFSEQLKTFGKKEFKKLYDDITKKYTKGDCEIDFGDWSNYESEIKEGTEMCQIYCDIISQEDVAIVGSEVCGLVDIPGIDKPIYVGIDFILDTDLGYVLGDIKTGKTGPTPHYLKNDIQLKAYAYGLKHGRSIIGFNNLSSNKKTEHFFGSKKIAAVCILNLRDKVKNKKPWHSTDLWYMYDIEEKIDQNYVKELVTIYNSLSLAIEKNLWYKHTGSVTSSPCNFCSYCKQGDCV